MSQTLHSSPAPSQTKYLERYGTRVSSASLLCRQQSMCCAQYNSKKSQLQLPATSLREKQSEKSSKTESQAPS